MTAAAMMRGVTGVALVAVTTACGSTDAKVTADKTSEQLGVKPTKTVVNACPNNAGRPVPYTSLAIPESVQLPSLVTLPPGAAVYGTDMPDATGSHTYYVIGPAGKTCSAYTGSSLGAGIDIGPQGSGSGVHEIYRAGGPTNVADSVCPYIPEAIPAGGRSTCESTPAPGQALSTVSTNTPNMYVTVVRIPPGASKQGVAYTNTPEAERAASTLPTLAVFAAHITTSQEQPEHRVFAPQISCTLPPARVSTCSSALNYFLVQFAAREGMAPPDLARTVHAVDRLIA
jgi:hypothetical protein